MEFLGFGVNSAAWFVAGLVVGWNLLAQPEWVAKLYDKWFGDKEETEAEAETKVEVEVEKE